MGKKSKKQKRDHSSSSASSKSRDRSPRPKSPKKEQSPPKPIRVNKYALGSLLFENIRTNDRMDKTEVDKATKNLQKIDKTGRKAMLLSAAINTVQVDKQEKDYEVELVDGQYVKIPLPYLCGFSQCGKRFRFAKDLQKHLEDHKQTQESLKIF
ncbi:hypothetical protein pb186bvf_001421 [Paramecium bursaria]